MNEVEKRLEKLAQFDAKRGVALYPKRDPKFERILDLSVYRERLSLDQRIELAKLQLEFAKTRVADLEEEITFLTSI